MRVWVENVALILLSSWIPTGDLAGGGTRVLAYRTLLLRLCPHITAVSQDQIGANPVTFPPESSLFGLRGTF